MFQQMGEAPTIIKEHCNDATISSDVMFANDVLLLTSVSHDMHCGIISAVDNLTCPTLEIELCNIFYSYLARVFNVLLIMVELKFKSLRYRNRVGVKINELHRGEHAPVIERFHRVAEERCRCYFAKLPFDYLPL